MKAYIQHLSTMEFLKHDGGWSREIGEAQVFASAVDALAVCVKRRLDHVQIVLRFPDGEDGDEMNIPLEKGP